MKKIRLPAVLFAVLGTVLAALTVWISLSAAHMQPVLLNSSGQVRERADYMMRKFCEGDYAEAGSCLYGNPNMGSGAETESETGRLIWAAFVDSLSYELTGECYASDSGVSQNVRLHRLEIPSVTENLKDRAQTMLTERVKSAEDMSEVYDDDNNYREDFVMAALEDAARQAIAEDARFVEEELTLNLVYEQGQWWVLPDQALLNAISGGIM